MFCVFLHFTDFGRKSLKIYQILSVEQVYKNIEVGKLTFGKIQLRNNYEFDYCRKKKSKKSVIFGKIP